MSLFDFVACESFLSVAFEKAERISRKFRWLAPARRGSIACAFLVATAGSPAADAQTWQYTDLGNGGYAISGTRGVSDDGSAVAVTATSSDLKNPASDHAFLWTSSGGLTPLKDYGYGSAALSISGDGTVMAGAAIVNAAGTMHAVTWNASGTITDLGAGWTGGWSGANAVSADGKVVVGTSQFIAGANPQAFRWTSAGGMVNLGALVADGAREATATNGDGSVVVGTLDTKAPGFNYFTQHAFRWTLASNTMTDLGSLGGPSNNSYAEGVSRNGNVVLGMSVLADGTTLRAFRWTQTGGMVDLGVLPGSASSSAMAANSDGSIVVGASAQGTTGTAIGTAFRWTQATGMQNLNSVLANAGVNMTGITLGDATGISANGQFIVGGPYIGGGSGQTAMPKPASVAGDAWLVRYCDTTCASGSGPIAGVTTQASAQNSVSQIAQARTTVLAQQNALAAPLLGDGQRIGSPGVQAGSKFGEVGSFVAVGSLEGGAFARFDTETGISILGGISYQQASFQGARVQPSLLAALAVRYVYGGFGWIRPIAEAGGWLAPDASLSFTRTYANGAGQAIARASESGDLSYYYGRAGAAMPLGITNEIALTGEIGRERLDTRAFAEAASSVNPFNASGASATDAELVARVRAQLSHAFTPVIDASVWGAGVTTLDSTSNFAATVAGFGALLPARTAQTVWAEYGARLGYRLSESANLDLIANGASGASGASIGTEVHVGAALRYNF